MPKSNGYRNMLRQLIGDAIKTNMTCLGHHDARTLSAKT
jgi:hypothetical protein